MEEEGLWWRIKKINIELERWRKIEGEKDEKIDERM